MSGQLKTFIDRMVPIYTKIRAYIYIFLTAWDPNCTNLESTLEAIKVATRDCLEECTDKDVILASGVSEKRDIINHNEY